jgi:molybdenum cofactor synthesis domain-containing protein
MSICRAAFIVIGDEILSGRTQDANINYIATELTEIGIRLTECRVIPDVEEIIINTINEMRGHYDYVFTSGGIGPTHDDITSISVAKAFDVELKLNDDAVARLDHYYKEKGRELIESRLKMAMIPEGAELIGNSVSAAPGFYLENVYVMAGIPRIMQAMFALIKPELKHGDKLHSLEIPLFVSEGAIAHDLSELQNKYSAASIGSYPFVKDGKYGTSIVVRSTDARILPEIEKDLKTIKEKL